MEMMLMLMMTCHVYLSVLDGK